MESAVQSNLCPISVVVVGEDSLARRGLQSVLQESPRIRIVGEAKNADLALKLITRLGPDILLITFSTLSETHLSFISQVRKDFPRVYVILTGMAVEDEELLAAVEHGAFGFLPSDACTGDFEAAFKQALSGETPIMSEIAGGLLFHALMQLNGVDRDSELALSAREQEVLQRMAHGMSNKEIGADLNIQLGTVKAHVSNVLRKLGASDRTQAVVKAIREGIVEL